MTTKQQENYRIHDNVVYQRKSSEFVDIWEDCGVSTGNIEPVWKKEKLPLEIWNMAKGFCLWSQKEFKSEGIVLFFYDENKGWNIWAPPQKTFGMTVDVDEKHADYEKQRAEMPELMLGSLHHHCTSSAFQSGTDEADETNKDGIHFTLGKLDKENLDIHARFVYKKNCHEVNPINWVEMPSWVTDIPIPKLRYKAAEECLSIAANHSFPEFWKKNISKGVKSYVKSNLYGSTYQSSLSGKTQSYYTGWDNDYVMKEEPDPFGGGERALDPTNGIESAVEELADELNLSLWEIGYIINDGDELLNEEELAAKQMLPGLLKKYELSERDLCAVIEDCTGYAITDFTTG
jgi:hypothetical protein